MEQQTKKGNKPLKFKTVKELQDKINKYFERCDRENRPYTLTGLACELDTSRETLINYENKEAYFDTVKKAKLKIHQYAEESLWRGGGITTGVIFNLKNNWGWKDKSEIDNTFKVAEVNDETAKKILNSVNEQE